MPDVDMPEPIIELNYGDDPIVTMGAEADDVWFSKHPHANFYVRSAIDGELAAAGYPDWQGLLVIIRIGSGIRIRRPILTAEDGASEAERYIRLLRD